MALHRHFIGYPLHVPFDPLIELVASAPGSDPRLRLRVVFSPVRWAEQSDHFHPSRMVFPMRSQDVRIDAHREDGKRDQASRQEANLAALLIPSLSIAKTPQSPSVKSHLLFLFLSCLLYIQIIVTMLCQIRTDQIIQFIFCVIKYLDPISFLFFYYLGSFSLIVIHVACAISLTSNWDGMIWDIQPSICFVEVEVAIAFLLLKFRFSLNLSDSFIWIPLMDLRLFFLLRLLLQPYK